MHKTKAHKSIKSRLRQDMLSKEIDLRYLVMKSSGNIEVCYTVMKIIFMSHLMR